MPYYIIRKQHSRFPQKKWAVINGKGQVQVWKETKAEARKAAEKMKR